MRPSKLRGMLQGLPYKLFPGFPVRFVIFSPVFRRGITAKSGFQALDFALTVFRIHFTLSSKSTLFLLVFLFDLIQNSSALRTIPGALFKRRTRHCYCGTHKAVSRPSRVQDRPGLSEDLNKSPVSDFKFETRHCHYIHRLS